MALEVEALNVASSILDVAQVAAAADETPAWLGGLLGMVVVMTALILIWACCAITGSYFVKTAKGKPAPGKTEAAPKALAVSQPAAAASSEIPLAVIIAAAVQMVQAPIRNVVVSVPGRESVTWTSQGREAIFTSHAPKAPTAVHPLGTIRQK